ncbi:hypothetical protein C8F04DRAFT_1273082 [Mycena alexandri]|uniref:Uncharacterized protein n=1 Tax=Mycena alexandri TaxID=1745969 RepID=A0AAD6WP96_9AGAR|nr:hypothetical protein C8F04DRAFT_1273082 [Mycena alexandri]
MPAFHFNICCAHRVQPVVKRPKKILREEEKEEAKVKREINRRLRKRRVEWVATLPGPWVEVRRPSAISRARTYVMYKSDAKQAFGLTETEILTLRRESMPQSSKTYFALEDARTLQRRKFEALALLSAEPTGTWRVLEATTSSGCRRKANFYEIHDGDALLYERRYLNAPRRTKAGATAKMAS